MFNFGYYAVRLLSRIRPSAIGQSFFHKTAAIGSASRIWNCSFGRYSYCGSECVINNCNIGSFCSIADNVVIGSLSHAIDSVSTSPVFQAGRNILGINFSCHPQPESKITHIGHDVWIGRGAQVSAGITIGSGAVIGMGSIVTKDVEPYMIVGGVPARLIRERFSRDIACALLESEWWLLDEELLKTHSQLFQKPEEYLRDKAHL